MRASLDEEDAGMLLVDGTLSSGVAGIQASALRKEDGRESFNEHAKTKEEPGVQHISCTPMLRESD